MASISSFGDLNSGLQAAVINGNVTAQFLKSESLNQACLRDLRATDPHHDKERIKDTKGGLLEDCYRWIFDNHAFKQWQHSQSNRLLWIRGDPGKGKTMLLCGIIEELTHLYGDSATISFFFCQATDIRINNATSVLRGLIYLLVEKNPSLLPYVRSQYEKAGRALFEDVNAWSALTSIFTNMLEDPSLKAAYIVIDALDECTSGLDSLLKLIIQKATVHQQVKWVISSRNHANIVKRLNSATQIAPVSLELNEASVSAAVKLFIEHRVDDIADAAEYNPKTRSIVKDHLLLHSQDTFLWAALVCKELEDTEWWHAEEIVRTFPPGLSALYRRMLDHVKQTRNAQICKQILSIISLVHRPITLSELGALIEGRIDGPIDPVMLRQIVGFCGSFVTLREQKIHLVHQSAKDFLTKEASTEILPKGVESEHHAIFSQCLSALMKTLRRDVFDLRLPGIPIQDIKVPSPNPLAPIEGSEHIKKSFRWHTRYEKAGRFKSGGHRM
ncbi:Uncharacterized protein PECH_002543 [Penicillium ucsense]|uniref:NACHT domain-containing protein n=1 Tax=Penicillium ucsense TaxID=2839758 RepID=A0A8J8VYP0_9EURO|nr:Uncharacterized protein PECM_001965 [Penicillium ucsense]KAF7730765.1 Uncharacterized protein PECH_002543 [Penicillium ucsense]